MLSSSYAIEDNQLLRQQHYHRPLSPPVTDHRETLDCPIQHHRYNDIRNLSNRSLIDDCYNTSDDDEDEGQLIDENKNDDRDDNQMYGVLPSGIEYKYTRVLAEGWLHKKGSGNDFFGSVRWKARYCRLVLAKLNSGSASSIVEVPLLLIFWYNHSDVPSTIITLDSTVCMAVDGDDKTSWNYHCFNIIHAKGINFKETTRTFTLPRKGRDAWVYAINQALYNYEKEKASKKSSTTNYNGMMGGATSRRPKQKTLSSAFHSYNAPLTLGLWSGDQYVDLSEERMPISPPASPRSLRKRPLPRPDVLVGESFLR